MLLLLLLLLSLLSLLLLLLLLLLQRFQHADCLGAPQLIHFDASPLARSSWNLEENYAGRKTGKPGEKPSKQSQNQQQTQPTNDTERPKGSHQCVILVPLKLDAKR